MYTRGGVTSLLLFVFFIGLTGCDHSGKGTGSSGLGNTVAVTPPVIDNTGPELVALLGKISLSKALIPATDSVPCDISVNNLAAIPPDTLLTVTSDDEEIISYNETDKKLEVKKRPADKNY